MLSSTRVLNYFTRLSEHNQIALEKEMDLYNNAIGYILFDENKKLALDVYTASDKVMEALGEGKLRYIKDGKLVPTNE